MKDSFGTAAKIKVGASSYRIRRLTALKGVDRLPYSLRIVLENLLRFEDGVNVTAGHVQALLAWDPAAEPDREIAFTPARVLLQDFTGVPAVVDLAAMRDAMKALRGTPKKINPLMPVELVIDHSVQVDRFGSGDAFAANVDREFERNGERYSFLRWGQKAFRNFRVVPPGTGIVHQVNLEYLARVVMADRGWAYPDTLLGTDSHTTMINGLGVLGWGVGGIEAEAAMLGQPVSMLIPQVVGVRLKGELREGTTATDLVLTVTQILRKRNVVGKFVEFFGPGLAGLALADRATIANMAPEYGATCGLFPFDEASLDYLKFSGRRPDTIRLVEAYLKEQDLFASAGAPEPRYSDLVELDLGSVEASLAGPKRPQDRVALRDVPKSFAEMAKPDGNGEGVQNGSVVIAAITSCTNTSNPSVMLAAGILAKKAVDRGLATPPWVKTSLAPGSKVVTEYLREAGLQPALERLGFHLVGYGCTTCIGNSGPLAGEIASAIDQGGLAVAAVLSGNRNFEGRIHPKVKANYLASPPLVVAFALAGRVDIDLESQPLGKDRSGRPVFLREIWPTQKEVADAVRAAVGAEMYRRTYDDVFTGDNQWRAMRIPAGDTFAWEGKSTYVRLPPYFDAMPRNPAPVTDISGARVLVTLGDSITTDHISPAGDIPADGPAGRYLIEHGVDPRDFNSFGARRGNHEVMMRGTFANVRLKNRVVAGVEGGFTLHLPDGAKMTIYDAAMRYRAEGVPLIVLAGKEYGSGSSRDWAAKGPMLLGVRAAIAESFERIHRSNLIGMGVAPLQFLPGQNAESLGLTGRETYDVVGLASGLASGFAQGREIVVRARGEGGTKEFRARARVDTPKEIEYMLHGGILPFVLRDLISEETRPCAAPRIRRKGARASRRSPRRRASS